MSVHRVICVLFSLTAVLLLLRLNSVDGATFAVPEPTDIFGVKLRDLPKLQAQKTLEERRKQQLAQLAADLYLKEQPKPHPKSWDFAIPTDHEAGLPLALKLLQIATEILSRLEDKKRDVDFTTLHKGQGLFATSDHNPSPPKPPSIFTLPWEDVEEPLVEGPSDLAEHDHYFDIIRFESSDVERVRELKETVETILALVPDMWEVDVKNPPTPVGDGKADETVEIILGMEVKLRLREVVTNKDGVEPFTLFHHQNQELTLSEVAAALTARLATIFGRAIVERLKIVDDAKEGEHKPHNVALLDEIVTRIETMFIHESKRSEQILKEMTSQWETKELELEKEFISRFFASNSDGSVKTVPATSEWFFAIRPNSEESLSSARKILDIASAYLNCMGLGPRMLAVKLYNWRKRVPADQPTKRTFLTGLVTHFVAECDKLLKDASGIGMFFDLYGVMRATLQEHNQVCEEVEFRAVSLLELISALGEAFESSTNDDDEKSLKKYKSYVCAMVMHVTHADLGGKDRKTALIDSIGFSIVGAHPDDPYNAYHTTLTLKTEDEWLAFKIVFNAYFYAGMYLEAIKANKASETAVELKDLLRDFKKTAPTQYSERHVKELKHFKLTF